MLFIAIFVPLAAAIFSQTFATTNNDRYGPIALPLIGGRETTNKRSSWLVLLQATQITDRLFGFIPIKRKHNWCGGSLISSRWVLTAAHCFYDNLHPLPAHLWKARVGSVNLKFSFKEKVMDLFGKIFSKHNWRRWNVKVDKIIIHPNYDPGNFRTNDIALVRLKTPIPLAAHIQNARAVKLPENNDGSFPRTGQRCQVQGWGCTTKGGDVNKLAHEISLPIVTNEKCSSYYGNSINADHICAGYRDSGKGICNGDSGGPLVCQRPGGRDWIQVGITSYTSEKYPGSYPGVFTRVSSYATWIGLVQRQNS